MSNLTPELNLVQGEDEDDTADYLTIGLAGSLSTIDGLFNASTGHAHNGAHQGGQLQFLDLTIGEDLTVMGTLVVQSTTTLQGALNVTGLATFSGGIVAPFTDLTYGTAVHSAATVYDVPAGIAMVFVTVSGATVRLPAAGAWQQKGPITISSNFNVTTNVAAVSGGVYGGSFNPSTGAVLNGQVISGPSTMDSITYKSDGGSWRAI